MTLFILRAITVSLTVLTMSLAPLHDGLALTHERSVTEFPPDDEGDCSDAGFYPSGKIIIPSIAVRICDQCRITEFDRYTVLLSYADEARRAGYFIDPLYSVVFTIIETGVRPNGKPYLRGVIGNRWIEVDERSADETIATSAGKFVLIAVASDLGR